MSSLLLLRAQMTWVFNAYDKNCDQKEVFLFEKTRTLFHLLLKFITVIYHMLVF